MNVLVPRTHKKSFIRRRVARVSQHAIVRYDVIVKAILAYITNCIRILEISSSLVNYMLYYSMECKIQRLMYFLQV